MSMMQVSGRGPLLMRRSFLIIVRAALFVLLVAVLAIGLWLVRPVQTGAGDMSRFQAGQVYLGLALDQSGMCKQAYILGIGSSLVLAPANAVEDAARNEITWAGFPRRVWELFRGYLDGIFHNPPPYECGLPRPADWTSDLLTR